MTMNKDEAIKTLREAAQLALDTGTLPVVEEALLEVLAATSHIAPDAVKAEGRTDRQIVDQTEELAAALALYEGYESTVPFMTSPNPHAIKFWKLACIAQEMLTATDPMDAASEIEEGESAPAIAPEASELPPSFATVKRLDGTDCPVYTAEQVRAAIAMHRAAAAKPDDQQPKWANVPTLTLTGNQLRAALEMLAPTGPDGIFDPAELEGDLTFGVVRHQDDDGKEITGMCCWNDDTDGVLPLDDEYVPQAAAVNQAAAEPAPAKPAITLTEEGIQFADGSAISKDGEITGPMAEKMAKQILATRKAAEPVPTAYTTTIGEDGEYELRRDGKMVGRIDYYEDAQRIMNALATKPAASEAVGEWTVGNLLTMSDCDYPGMGRMFGQIWQGDDLIARVYGDSANEVRERTARIVAPAAPTDAKPLPASPTCQELEALWEGSHYGHPADFAADVLERWGGWPKGVLGYGGSLDMTAAPADAKPLAVELVGVQEQIEESRGFWHSCSGCHDTEDGHPTGNYAHSRVFGCALGSGCGECGGIGAVWDNNDYSEDAHDDDDALKSSPQAPKTEGGE